MSQSELIGQFQMVTGTSDDVCRRFLSNAQWNLEGALSAYFDAGLDPPDTLTQPAFVPIPTIIDEPPTTDLPAALFDKKSKTRAVLRGVRVRGGVQDLLADITVDFRFENSTPNPLEATFRFKQDEVSSVKSYEVFIGDRHIKAQVQEKEAARDTYDDAIAGGHTAFTLEKEEKEIGVLVANVGNLAPGQDCIISVSYITSLLMEDREATLLLPATSTPLLMSQEQSNASSSTASSISPILNAAAQLGFSPTDPVSGREIEHVDQLTKRDFVGLVLFLEINQSSPIAQTKTVPSDLETNIVQKAGVDTALFYYSQSSLATAIRVRIELAAPNDTRGICELANATQTKNAVVVSFYPKIELPDDMDLQTEIIFLVDRSGSMAGSRMRQAKNALQLFLRSLPEGTYFNIVSFGTRHEKLFTSSVIYNESSFNRARAAVDSMDADMGGTEILAPLRDILQLPVRPRYPRQLFCLTDGEVSNTIEILKLVRNQAGTTRVFTFGIGADASKDLVMGMAREGRGRAEFVVSGERAETKVLQQLRRALQPAVEGLQVQWFDERHTEIVNDIQHTPVVLPPVFDGDQLLVYSLTSQRPTEAKLSGIIGNDRQVDWIAQIHANVARPSLIHSMAAASIIRDLEMQYERQPSQATKQQIIDTSVRYGIISQFTAFIAVDESESSSATGNLVQIQVGDELFTPAKPVKPAPVLAPLLDFGAVGGARRASDHSIQNVSAQVCEVKDIMQSNIQGLLSRGEALDFLQEQSDSLSYASNSFRQQAKSKSIATGIGSVWNSLTNMFSFDQGSSSAAPPPTSSMPASTSLSAPPPPPSSFSYAPNPQSGAVMPPSFSSASSRPIAPLAQPVSSAKCEYDGVPKKRVTRIVRKKVSRPLYDDEEDEEEEVEDLFGSDQSQQQSQQLPYNEPVVPINRNMDTLIFQQTSTGSWKYSSTCAAAMGLSIQTVATNQPSGIDQDVWMTVLAIVCLRQYFAEEEAQWGLLVEKASKWVRRQLTSTPTTSYSFDNLCSIAQGLFA